MSDCSTGILWLDIFIMIILPVCIGPLFLFAKSLWDRYNIYKINRIQMKFNQVTDKYKQQLQNFYWPLYVYLLEEYILWNTIRTNENMDLEDTYSETDSDYGLDNDIYKSCQYVDKTTGKQCNNIVPVQCRSDNAQILCIRHICRYESSSNVFKEFSINDGSAVTMDIKDLEKGDFNTTIVFNDKTIAKMQNKLIENHGRVVKIIEDNIYIAEPSYSMRRLLMKYIQFTSLLNVLMSSNDDVEKIKMMGIKYPRKLLPLIEKKVNNIQEKYNEVIKNYFD